VRAIPARLLVGNPQTVCCPTCGKAAVVLENGCLQCLECKDGQLKIWAPDPEDEVLWSMFTSFAQRAHIFPDELSRLRAEMMTSPAGNDDALKRRA
jgi:hypothetical protein